MLTKVRHLEPIGGFRLAVEFNDGSHGTHDFAAMVGEPGPMLAALRDETYFARVFLERGAPTWPNGFDVAPEWLERRISRKSSRHGHQPHLRNELGVGCAATNCGRARALVTG